MRLSAVIATMGLGAIAGAATVLMMPKQCEVYRIANHAAKNLKHGAEKIIGNMEAMD